jgi:hypothetical protein
MEFSDAKAFIELVSAESLRRDGLLDAEDSDYAYDHWMFTDLPFLHDLCLLFLIAVHHQVERRLLYLAARVTADGKILTSNEFQKRRTELNGLSIQKRGVEVKRRLEPQACSRYASVEALRLLANAYKHDPDAAPDRKLVRHLGLDEALTYASLPESRELQKAMARLVGLNERSGFAAITEAFVKHAEEFLEDVQTRKAKVLSPHEPAIISLDDFAY